MDLAANRAISIGVGIFVTLAIASTIFLIMSQVKTVYKEADEIDINIHSRVSEYIMYDNTVLVGLDMVNTAKKYRNNSLVKVMFNGIQINLDEDTNSGSFLKLNEDSNDRDYTSRLYDVKYDIAQNEMVTITFSYKN